MKILHEYDPRWVQEFERLKTVYCKALGKLVRRAEHVGSTAIPGMAAKPILDIDLVISSESKFPDVRSILELLGYRHVGDQGILGREVFKREGEKVPYVEPFGDGWMKHHLYVCVDGTRELQRHLAFRDYLNADPVAREEYESIKKDIESRSAGDRKRYAEMKEKEGVCSAFVERVLSQAG